jgi:hypothetical protein
VPLEGEGKPQSRALSRGVSEMAAQPDICRLST